MECHIGYYHTVQGLGEYPTDTKIRSVQVLNGSPRLDIGGLNNFWRSAENFTTGWGVDGKDSDGKQIWDTEPLVGEGNQMIPSSAYFGSAGDRMVPAKQNFRPPPSVPRWSRQSSAHVTL